MARNLISRIEAIASEEKRYYTGVPCCKGHDAERYSSSRKCCECDRLKQQRQAAEDPEGKRKREKEYYWANLEKSRARRRSTGQRHYANHIEEQRERSKKKHAENPQQTLERGKRRLQRMRLATPALTAEERQQIAALYMDAREATEKTGIVHHVDHVVPIARGGLNHPENMRVITRDENLRKGVRIDVVDILIS